MALPQQCRAPWPYRKDDMAEIEGVKRMDVILFQRIGGGRRRGRANRGGGSRTLMDCRWLTVH